MCFFVCSGSEVNELVLWMVRMYMGGYDVVVFDVVYYGNIFVFVELSLYKYEGRGGLGLGAHVYKVLMFDFY